MQKHDLLRSFAGGLVENLGPSPDRSVDVDVPACEVVFIGFGLIIFFNWCSILAVAEEFEESGNQVTILRVLHLVAMDADTFLEDVHALVRRKPVIRWIHRGLPLYLLTCKPTKLVYGAIGSASKNFFHC